MLPAYLGCGPSSNWPFNLTLPPPPHPPTHSYKADDEAVARKVEAKNSLENYAYGLRNTVGEAAAWFALHEACYHSMA